MRQSRSGIFISYARSDDLKLADKVRKCLKKAGFKVRQDLSDLQAGERWWEELQRVIRHSEYLVLVATPGALESASVEREWRLAREEGCA